ncbi:protein of unknown function [Geodermatophilus dictyosporus]|uniref:DUF4333 domain-containing protein n=1 Tax=Geodermatophilus dictyosporus TaxID=1523247 RepID=A0A1I5RS75_9ACTN|nr:DUF4333 domain-containing protein [Geodermatophilus dictyosporus]SFP61343.1 protein of unknown function [Geodermatophilus dictyosporus]
MTQIHDPRYGSPNPQGPGPYGPPPFPAPGYGAPGGYGQPQRKKKHTGAIVGSIVAVLVLAGLGVGAFFLFGTSYLDTAEAERQIATLTEEQAGVTVTDVTCPEDVELAAGTVTTCTAMVEGQEVGYTVEQTDDEGNVRIDSTGVFVQVTDVEAALVDEFATSAGLSVDAACDAGDRSVLVAEDGLQLICDVALVDDPTDMGTVTALIDAEGNVTFDAS